MGHKVQYEPGSKLLVLGMVIQPLIGNPYNGYINPYYWVDDHPLWYGNNGSLDPSTYIFIINMEIHQDSPFGIEKKHAWTFHKGCQMVAKRFQKTITIP